MKTNTSTEVNPQAIIDALSVLHAAGVLSWNPCEACDECETLHADITLSFAPNLTKPSSFKGLLMGYDDQNFRSQTSSTSS
jgi:hypothetical protein